MTPPEPRDALMTPPAPGANNTDRPVWHGVDPKRWSTPILAAFLEAHKAGERGLAFVQENQLTGDSMGEIIEDREVHTMLAEDLAMPNRTLRVALITAYRRWGTMYTSVQLTSDPRDSARVATIVGERAVEIPSLPKVMTGQPLCSIDG